MKRRWWIDRAALFIPNGQVCGQARWVWLRTMPDRAATQMVGCVCHHNWTKHVRSFQEVPDAAR